MLLTVYICDITLVYFKFSYGTNCDSLKNQCLDNAM